MGPIILLGGKVPNYGEVAIDLVGDSRIGDIFLRDDGNALRSPNIGVAFSLWVNRDRPSIGAIGIIGWPWEGISQSQSSRAAARENGRTLSQNGFPEK